MVTVQKEDLGGDDDTVRFSADERAQLIQAVSGQSGDLIDWLNISANVFGNKFSPRECIFEFLKLPIPQSLALNTHSTNETSIEIKSEANSNFDISRGMQGEFPSTGSLTVFNDSGNPLLA